MCGGTPTQRDLEIVAEFQEFLRNLGKGRRMATPSDTFESPPKGEEVPETVKGGTDFNAPDLSEYSEAEATEDDTEYRDPLSEGDESSD